MPHKSARYMENLEKDLSFNREREEFELIAPKRHILNNQSSLKSNFKSEKNYSNSTLNQVHANLQENSLNRSSESFHSFNNTYDSPNLNYKHVKSYGHSNKVESDKFLNSHIGQKNSYQNISSCSTGPYQSYETYYSPSQCNNTFISCPHMPHVIQSAPYKVFLILKIIIFLELFNSSLGFRPTSNEPVPYSGRVCLPKTK